MPSDEATLKEKRLERLVLSLAQDLAIMLAYLSAIEDAVDPFEDVDIDKSWIVAGLAADAKRQVFHDCQGSQPYGKDTREVIEAARANKHNDIKGTDLYLQSRTSISRLVRARARKISAS
jgi:hypothetical protein